MKINFDTNYISPYNNMKKTITKAADTVKPTRNFDEITIHSAVVNPSDSASAETVFADALSKRLLLELRKPTSTQKIEELQQQIEQGTYEVDINRIADRIMLY